MSDLPKNAMGKSFLWENEAGDNEEPRTPKRRLRLHQGDD